MKPEKVPKLFDLDPHECIFNDLFGSGQAVTRFHVWCSMGSNVVYIYNLYQYVLHMSVGICKT